MTMQAHPMIVPFATPDEPAAAKLSQNGQEVFNLLYDMVSAYTLGRPQWNVERWVVTLEGNVYAAERWQLIHEGWRSIPSHHDFPRHSLFQLPSEAALPLPSAEVIAESIERLPLHPQTNLGDFIGIMASEGLGRPSTFAAHAQKLLDRKWVDGIDNANLTDKGRETLHKIRESEAACYNMGFCKAFLSSLDAIEEGQKSPRDCLNEWFGPQAEPLSSWIESQQIEGDLAGAAYEARDGADRATVFWPAGWLPAGIDPERTVPPDSEWRLKRASINQSAAQSTNGQWLNLTAKQRSSARIKILAGEEGISVKEWEDKYCFDLLARWLVGWSD